MRSSIVRAIAIVSVTTAVPAFAQPSHPQPQVPDPAPDVPPPSTTDPTEPATTPPQDAPPPAPAMTTPPIVTISTMPVTKDIPGEWDDRPRTVAWIGTGVAGATLAATIGWYFYHDRYTHTAKQQADTPCIPSSDGQGDTNNCYALNVGETTTRQHKQDIWFRTELGLCVATGATMLVSAYLWSRHYTPARHILVSPTQNGATVGFDGSF